MQISGSPNPTIQRILGEVKGLKQSSLRLTSGYQACSVRFQEAVGDTKSMAGPLASAMADTGLRIVSGDGVTLRNEIAEAKSRVVQNTNHIARLRTDSESVNPRYGSVYEQLGQFAAEVSGNPTAALAIQNAREAIYASSAQHQAASRAATWGDGKAQIAERELNWTTNHVTNIMGDAQGKSVAADAIYINPFVKKATVYMGEAKVHLDDTLGHQDYATRALEYVEEQLALAEEALDPFTFESLFSDRR